MNSFTEDRIFISEKREIYILIREVKTLHPFLQKMRGRCSIKFGTLIVYM